MTSRGASGLRLVATLVAATGLGAACADDALPGSAAAAVDLPELARVRSTSTDPAVHDFALDAVESTTRFGELPPTRTWTYNGQSPGPLLEARVGDRVVAHFTNRLPEPTTVHWHGVRLPAAMDGSVAMQSPVPPGGTFRYEFVLKDAGLYWFHPHVRTDVQVEKGLVGVIRVRGPHEPVVDDERLLVLDDVRLDADGSFPEYLDDESKMMGREGNLVLVNGAPTPVVRVRPGATVRLRLLSAANGRFFHLALGDLPLRVIGTDGGLVPHPYDADHVLLGPAERLDVVARMPLASGSIDLRSDPYERGHHSGDRPPVRVARFVVEGEPVTSPAPLPERFPDLERLPAPAEDAVWPLRLGERTNAKGDLVFTINDATFPDVPMLMTSLGSVRGLDVVNTSDMDHPFHLHGFFFQVLSRGGVPEPTERLANEDTVIVPARSNLRLVARFDEPGMWMYHCHINEHSEGGMMGDIHVH